MCSGPSGRPVSPCHRSHPPSGGGRARVGLVCDASTGGERAERTLADLTPYLALGVTRVPMRRTRMRATFTSCAPCDRKPSPSAPMCCTAWRERRRLCRLARSAGRARRDPRYTPHGGSYKLPSGHDPHRVYMAAEQVMARATDLCLFESEYVASRHAGLRRRLAALERIVHNGIAKPSSPRWRRRMTLRSCLCR